MVLEERVLQNNSRKILEEMEEKVVDWQLTLNGSKGNPILLICLRTSCGFRPVA